MTWREQKQRGLISRASIASLLPDLSPCIKNRRTARHGHARCTAIRDFITSDGLLRISISQESCLHRDRETEKSPRIHPCNFTTEPSIKPAKNHSARGSERSQNQGRSIISSLIAMPRVITSRKISPMFLFRRPPSASSAERLVPHIDCYQKPSGWQQLCPCHSALIPRARKSLKPLNPRVGASFYGSVIGWSRLPAWVFTMPHSVLSKAVRRLFSVRRAIARQVLPLSRSRLLD